MTLREFTQGWMLLTAQPWGTPYRKEAALPGEPSPGDIQSEFYFHTFKDSDGPAWLKSCQQHATGDKWPSVDALKLSLRHHTPALTALPTPDVPVISMEEALRERPDLQATLQRVLKTNGVDL